MALKNFLMNIDLSYLQPIIDFLNAWYVQIILILVAAGIIYAIILGVNLAKSDSGETREKMKKRIVNATLTIVIVIVLTFTMQFVLSHLNTWVNGGWNVVTENYIETQACEINGSTLGNFDWNNNLKRFEANLGTETGEVKVRLNVDSARYDNVTLKYDDTTNNYVTKFGHKDGNNGELKELVITESSPANGSIYVPLYDKQGKIIVGYYEIYWTRTVQSAQTV